MHELSIALSLVDVACGELTRFSPGTQITAVHVRVGPLAGVVPEALSFSFEIAAQGSAIEGARLEIERVPLTAWCEGCAAEQPIASIQALRCPVCGGLASEVISGRELQLAALEVVDGPDR